MNIKVSNIGKISHADIAVNGLTLIAGENDTGKSTIGKLLFSIVKGVSRFEQDLQESKEDAIIHKIESLYFSLRRYKRFSDKEIRDEFSPRVFVHQLKPFVNEIEQVSLFGPQNTESELDEIFDRKKEILKKIGDTAYDKNQELLEEIKSLLFIEEEKEDVVKRALSRAFYSEFYLELSPKNAKDKLSHVSLYEESGEILNALIKNDKIEKLSIYDDLFFDDVTFIETPIFLQIYDVLRSSTTLFGENRRSVIGRYPVQVSLHIRDLISKIENSRLVNDLMSDSGLLHNGQIKRISDIINGGFKYDKENRDFIFSSKSSEKKKSKIRTVNTASGVKVFGIIQLLLQAGVLDDRSLLIIDEPENHLHPKWQVEYARLIVELVKSDLTVIISSHSPYMIQALKYFSDQSNIQEKTRYYLASIIKHDETEIEDVTENLGRIFKKLSDPLKDLVWRK